MVPVRPLLLDLFCCEGGAATGYHRAGFDVIGVDLNRAHLERYPFPCMQGDALAIGAAIGHRFDAIHASPPCQRYSAATKGSGNPDDHPDLVDPVRQLLEAIGRPYVIENVVGAPVRPDVVLCGSMFGMSIRRHRLFELGGWFTLQHGCSGHDRETFDLTGFAGGRNQTKRDWRPLKYYDADHARELIGMPWASRRGCTEAIPPVYTEWLGAQLMEVVGLARAG